MGWSKKAKLTYRYVFCFVIDVYKRTLHIWQKLKLVLQLLTDVVCSPEWGVSVHDNVDLKEITLLNER
jgi:hypothetical protein